MVILVLGRGKTGQLVAEVASQRGHSVRVLGEEENKNASALTAPTLAHFDVVVDFTTPEAVLPNLRACFANGARVVVGTTGWYANLDEMRAMCERKNAGLLYGTNFSIGIQIMYQLARELARAAPGYAVSLSETHHTDKKDAPSGTALSLKEVLQSVNPLLDVEITSHRVGDASGIHVVQARSPDDLIEIRHEAFSRRGFAEGAIRAAEWLAGRQGCYEFREIYPLLT